MKHDEPEFTPEQVEQQIDLLARFSKTGAAPSFDERLISELYQVYTDDASIASSAWQRLAAQVNIASPRPVAGHTTVPGRSPLDVRVTWQKGSHLMHIETERKRSSQRFQHLGGLCAALLVIAVLVAGMVLLLNGGRQHQGQLLFTNQTTKTPTSVVNQGKVVYQSPPFRLSSPVAWSPDGTRVAAVINGTTVESWDALTGKHVLTYPLGQAYAFNQLGTNVVAWSPDGRTLAVATMQDVLLFNAQTGELLRSLSLPLALNEEMPSLRTPALSSLFQHSGGGSFRSPEDVSWSADGKKVSAFLSGDGIAIWDARTGALIKQLKGVYLINSTVNVRERWQPQGQHLASIECLDPICRTTQVSLWDTTTWSIVKQYPNIYTFDWSPDGAQLALISMDRTQVLMVNALTGQRVRQISSARNQRFFNVQWSPDGSRLALGSITSSSNVITKISIWNVASGQQLFVFSHPNCSLESWSPDSQYLSCIHYAKAGASGSMNEEIVIWIA
jgi:WD40 repeat protein